MLIRDDAWWARLARRGYVNEIALYLDENGEAQGYLSFAFKGVQMIVHELVGLTSVAETELWAFISSHDSMFEKVTIKNAGEVDELALSLANPTALRVTQELTFMVRIVDVKRFLERYPFPELEEPLYFKIKDETAPFNEGVYKVAKGIEKVSEAPRQEVVEANIGAFSQMLLGFARPELLRAQGKIKISKETAARLEAIIPHEIPRFYDNF